MKHIKTLFFTLVALLPYTIGQAQTADSVDVLDYDIAVDLSAGRPFVGDATLTLRLLQPCQSVTLDLIGSADTIWLNGSRLETTDLASIPTTGCTAGDTLTVRVAYHGEGYVENYGWGGFHFDNDMSYNLGVGFGTNPHVLGRALMPCRDNFHDKATYTLRVHTRTGWTAECSGILVSRTAEADGTERSVWRLAQPVSTYLVSVSQSAWKRVQSSVESLYGTYPLTLGYLQSDSAHVARAFAELDSVVPMFERCLGPYRWGRIGYIATTEGSMEHVNNIGLAKMFMTSLSERAQMTIAHELGHAWFGNLVTCRTEADMWFNEGGASFCSELAMEGKSGREAAIKYYQTNLETVLRQTHVTDGGYRPLSPMPHSLTYGSTTYDKGALVWHSLRGVLGDSVFYTAMTRLFSDKAFGTVDAAEVRDSLAAYTGTDLTGFFNFHVFGAGFVDCHATTDVSNCTEYVTGIRLRQQGIGTEATPAEGVMPVTFFSADGQQAKRWFDLGGSDTYHNTTLPFVPTFCVLDYDCEISDGATVADFRTGGTHSNSAVHFKYTGTLPEAGPMVVEHHWGHPWDIDTLTGMQRTTGRYWVVRGAQERFEGVQGQFRFVRTGYSNGSYTGLDAALQVNSASLDSVALLHRRGEGWPWHAVSRQRTGNTDEGYFVVDNLATGEYTLAVVDTALLAIAQTAASVQPTLFPNPVRRGQGITLQVPLDNGFAVRITDAAGRQVWHREDCRNGRKINPHLPSGTYLVTIENKYVSLQSKLIVL